LLQRLDNAPATRIVNNCPPGTANRIHILFEKLADGRRRRRALFDQRLQQAPLGGLFRADRAAGEVQLGEAGDELLRVRRGLGAWRRRRGRHRDAVGGLDDRRRTGSIRYFLRSQLAQLRIFGSVGGRGLSFEWRDQFRRLRESVGRWKPGIHAPPTTPAASWLTQITGRRAGLGARTLTVRFIPPM
jgi:hypothetical protein